MQGKIVSIQDDTTFTHRIIGLVIDVSGEVPSFTVTFEARVDDGSVVWVADMVLAGDDFVTHFGQPSNYPELSRIEDMTRVLCEYAISSNFIADGVFDPE